MIRWKEEFSTLINPRERKFSRTSLLPLTIEQSLWRRCFGAGSGGWFIWFDWVGRLRLIGSPAREQRYYLLTKRDSCSNLCICRYIIIRFAKVKCKSLEGYLSFSTEEMKNSSEEWNETSEEWNETSEEFFRSSEEIGISSGTIWEIPRIKSESIETIGNVWLTCQWNVRVHLCVCYLLILYYLCSTRVCCPLAGWLVLLSQVSP